MYIVTILIILALFFIAYQDFKYRAISWIVFPFLVLMLIFKYIYEDKDVFYAYFFINFIFVFIQLGFITIYLSLKKKQWVKIWENYLGLGDILFFLILCLVFSPGNYIAFYVASLCFVIIIITCIKLFKPNFSLIPLAGIQASLLALLLIFNHFTNAIDFMNDEWILRIF